MKTDYFDLEFNFSLYFFSKSSLCSSIEKFDTSLGSKFVKMNKCLQLKPIMQKNQCKEITSIRRNERSLKNKNTQYLSRIIRLRQTRMARWFVSQLSELLPTRSCQYLIKVAVWYHNITFLHTRLQ